MLIGYLVNFSKNINERRLAVRVSIMMIIIYIITIVNGDESDESCGSPFTSRTRANATHKYLNKFRRNCANNKFHRKFSCPAYAPNRSISRLAIAARHYNSLYSWHRLFSTWRTGSSQAIWRIEFFLSTICLLFCSFDHPKFEESECEWNHQNILCVFFVSDDCVHDRKHSLISF